MLHLQLITLHHPPSLPPLQSPDESKTTPSLKPYRAPSKASTAIFISHHQSCHEHRSCREDSHVRNPAVCYYQCRSADYKREKPKSSLPTRGLQKIENLPSQCHNLNLPNLSRPSSGQLHALPTISLNFDPSFSSSSPGSPTSINLPSAKTAIMSYATIVSK